MTNACSIQPTDHPTRTHSQPTTKNQQLTTGFPMQKEFIAQLDATIKQNQMLDHPFYQAWNMGKLSREALREYAKQYYHFVQAFPTLLSATHANTPHLSVKIGRASCRERV